MRLTNEKSVHIIINMSNITNTLSILSQNKIFTHLVDCNDVFLHEHDYYELVYVTNGSIQHQLNGKVKTLTTGDMLLLTPGDTHKFIRNDGKECTHRDIVVEREFFKEICDFIHEDAFTLLTETKHNATVRISLTQMLYFESVLNDLNLAVLTAESDLHAKFKGLCTPLIATIFSQLQDELQNSNAPNWFKILIERFHELKYITAGLKEILQDVHYSKIYVSKVFKERTGRTMTEYLNAMRLRYATLYLTTSTYTIAEIVEMLGFSSQTYFYNCFKKEFGCSPNKYRQQHQ